MKPHAFDYLRADSADEAVEQLRELGPDARILAGGQSLLPILNMRLAKPLALIDISRIDELNYMRAEDGMLLIGAAVTQASAEWRPGLAREVPLLAQVFPFIAHFQIRNRGTVCGSVAHADPSAELPLVLLALGGEVILRSASRRRTVSAQDFFQDMLVTACAPDELIEEVRFPLTGIDRRTAFAEFSTRRGDFAIVSAAAIDDADGVRVAVGGVAGRPRLTHLPRGLSEADLEAALNDFAWELDAQDDAHASARFRRHLVRRLCAQVVGRVTENK
jgi:2-furoyl-CoA dehydrogenase FAD binding subunit